VTRRRRRLAISFVMAVTSVKKSWEGRTGKDDWTRHRTYTQTYEVTTDDPADDVTVAGAAIDPSSGERIPRLGDLYPSDDAAVVVSIVPSQSSESPFCWVVSVEYDTQPKVPEAQQPTLTSPPPPPPSSEDNGKQGVDRPENPLGKPPVWKFGFEKTTEVAQRSLFGARLPFTNSAGLPFDPPPTVEVGRPTVTVTWNVAAVNFDRLDDWKDSVNSTTWWGKAPRTWRVINVEATSNFENKFYFWTITGTLAYKPETWDLQILDCGYAEKLFVDPNNAGSPIWVWQKIKDPWGQEATEPVPLDGNGRKLAANGTPVFLTFRYYPERDFNTAWPTILG
jgi:hypothetical protein